MVSWSENLGPIHGLERGAQPSDYEEYLQLIHPDDRGRISAAVQSALSEGKDYEIEMRTNPNVESSAGSGPTPASSAGRRASRCASSG